MSAFGACFRNSRSYAMARLLPFAYGSFLRFTAHSKLVLNDRNGSIAEVRPGGRALRLIGAEGA
jgi:hypothetical protein